MQPMELAVHREVVVPAAVLERLRAERAKAEQRARSVHGSILEGVSEQPVESVVAKEAAAR